MYGIITIQVPKMTVDLMTDMNDEPETWSTELYAADFIANNLAQGQGVAYSVVPLPTYE